MAKGFEAKKDIISARTIMWHIVFIGFGVNYMVRINMNIAIVSMIRQRHGGNTAITSSVCFGNESTTAVLKSNLVKGANFTTYYNFSESSDISDMNKSTILENPKEDELEGFAWNEYHQGLILGSYFWFHWLTQIPGGILARKYGAKLVFGLANFAGVVFCFFIPSVSYMGYEYLVALRAVQGLLTGFAWPAMHDMVGKWIPPNERSSFVSAYLGSSFGTAIIYPLCGWIIDKYGWEWVFHSNGVIGTVWYLLWCFLIFDSPEKHPRISETEKEYILSRLDKSNKSTEKVAVPWLKIFTSIPIWMNILAQWGGIWGFFTLMTHAPMYFKVIHGWDIKATGLLSGMPHIFRFVYSLLFSRFGDYLLKSNKMSRTNVRKLAVTNCCIIQGLFMLALAYTGCNYTAAIIFLTASVAANGAVATGPLASLVDISPNYASIGLGMCNTIVALVGFLIPSTVSYITFENQTVAQWQKVFWLATFMLIMTGIIHLLFSKSEVQPWNFPKDEAIVESELKSLNKKEENQDTEIVSKNSNKENCEEKC